MCPACFATVALVAGTVVTTGGIGVVIAKVLRPSNSKSSQQTTTDKENR